MDEVKRFGAVTVLVFGSLVMGLAASGFSAGSVASSLGGGAPGGNYTVTGLLEALPLERDVMVAGNVSAVLDDYTSDSGNTYQQFRVTDGNREVKVFCSTAGGRADVSTGVPVQVSGTFQEFYGEYEIYTRCGSVQTE